MSAYVAWGLVERVGTGQMALFRTNRCHTPTTSGITVLPTCVFVGLCTYGLKYNVKWKTSPKMILSTRSDLLLVPFSQVAPLVVDCALSNGLHPVLQSYGNPFLLLRDLHPWMVSLWFVPSPLGT